MEIKTLELGEKIEIEVNDGEIQRQSLNSTLCCPQIENPVANCDNQTFPVPGGQAIWWHCPACGGWHVVVQP